MPYNYGKKIIQANDGGYYILGNESGNIANTNIHIIRTDSLGIILYEKTIGDASVYSANDFIRTSDNGFLITGLTNKNQGNGYDVLLVKTDSNANVQWEKTYGGSDWDMGNSVIETFDNAYLISGQTFSFGPAQENIYIIKTNFSGDTIWTKVFGGDSTDYAMSASARFDSTYLIGATTNSFGHGNFDGYVLNLNQNGDTFWTQTYGEEKEDIINSIKSTPDSGFVFVGSTMSYNAIEHEGWLMKYDKNKNYIWKMPEFWDIKSGDDIIYSVALDDSGNYVICGSTTSFGSGGKDLIMLVMGENSTLIGGNTVGSVEDDIGYYGIKTSDSGYIIVGTTYGFGIGLSNIYLVKLAQDCSYGLTVDHVSNIIEFENENNNSSFYIYPNISIGRFYLNLINKDVADDFNLIVSDLLGNVIINQYIGSNILEPLLIDLSQKADGIYFITIINNHRSETVKVIKSGNQ